MLTSLMTMCVRKCVAVGLDSGNKEKSSRCQVKGTQLKLLLRPGVEDKLECDRDGAGLLWG